tara:strand:+ start:2925 stop:3506 length:582 start_codon:yes stop_codon:yes gene_type:complete
MAKDNKLVKNVQSSIFGDSGLQRIELREVTKDDFISWNGKDLSSGVVRPELIGDIHKVLEESITKEEVDSTVFWGELCKLVNYINDAYVIEMVDLLTCMVIREYKTERTYTEINHRIEDIDKEIAFLKKEKIVMKQNLHQFESNYILDLYEEKNWCIFDTKIPLDIIKEVKYRFKRNSTKRDDLEYQFDRKDL